MAHVLVRYYGGRQRGAGLHGARAAAPGCAVGALLRMGLPRRPLRLACQRHPRRSRRWRPPRLPAPAPAPAPPSAHKDLVDAWHEALEATAECAGSRGLRAGALHRGLAGSGWKPGAQERRAAPPDNCSAAARSPPAAAHLTPLPPRPALPLSEKGSRIYSLRKRLNDNSVWLSYGSWDDYDAFREHMEWVAFWGVGAGLAVGRAVGGVVGRVGWGLELATPCRRALVMAQA
jgi:hypothetical protein